MLLQFNLWFGAGQLTADPELKQTKTGKSVCQFTLAVTDLSGQVDANGNRPSDFFTCIAWEKTAENIAKNFHKGSPIFVTGKIKNNNYTDKNGVQHYGQRINVISFNYNSPSQNSVQQQAQPQVQAPVPNAYPQQNVQPAYMPQAYMQPPTAPNWNINSDEEDLPF